MERIKEALNRARGDAAGANRLSPLASRKSVALDNESHLFDYTHTRRLELSRSYLQKHRVISSPDDPVAEHYKVLRTRLIQSMRANGWGTLGITSPTEGVGKTLTAINLAISLARELNHTVLLVDLDLRQPKIHRYLFNEELRGIIDYLNGDEPLQNFLVNPGIDRLIVLPGSRPLQHSSELLSSPKMVNLAKELKERYRTRFIVYDLPPVLACDDVVAFSPNYDASLMVVEDGCTTKEDLRSAINLLGNHPFLGTVLNKVELYSRHGYGY